MPVPPVSCAIGLLPSPPQRWRSSRNTGYTELIARSRSRGAALARQRAQLMAADSAAPSIRLPLWSRPGYLVRRLHQIHTALFAEECKAFAITPVQYGLLTALLHFPGSD